MRYCVVGKRVGETPLQALARVRKALALPQDTKMAYAGRLDPMASGKLLILVGEECKRQDKYFNLDKEYIFEVLRGIKSDTGDILGVVSEFASKPISPKALRGTLTLPYPSFSSMNVLGKPLFQWSLEGRLNEITIPNATTEVYKLDKIDQYELNNTDLLKYVQDKISLLPKVDEETKELGKDFRRREVIKKWEEYLGQHKHNFVIEKYKCVASSGTYMRTLAEKLGGLALSIHRTKIGKYAKLPFGFGIWTSTL